LKPVLISFYNDEELTVAKNTLHKALADAGTADLPRLIARKGEQKTKMTVDDLLELFVIVDERKLLSKLPRFVTDNLSRIPTVCQDNLSNVSLARKFEQLENRVASLCNLETRVLQLEHLATAKVQPVNLSTQAAPSEQQASGGGSVTPSDVNSNKVDCHGILISSATVPVKDDAKKSPSTDWAIVDYGKHKGAANAAKQQSNRPKAKKILGEGGGEDSGLQSAVQIQRKSVFHIDNLKMTSTTTTVERHLQEHGIDVISCHPAKSWMRENERNQVTAFRVCILAKNREHIMDKMFWPKGVLIRDWKFKNNKQH
jgi:hypothetical protein